MVRTRYKGEFGIEVHAYNRTQQGLRAAAGQVRGFASQINSQAGYTAGALSAATAGMTAGLTAGAGALLLFGREGLQEFAKLEKQIIEVQTLLGDMETDTRQMTNSVQNLSRATGLAGGDIASGWYNAVSAGVEFNESLITIGDSAVGAIAGLSDLETATRASAAGMNAFGETALSTQDKAFASVKLGVVQYENIATAIGKFAGTGAAANLELSEMLSGLTTLTIQGVSAEEGVVQINNAVNQLLKAGSQAGALFQELAGMTFPEFTAQGGTLADAVRMIGEEAERTGKSIFDLVPEARAARGFQLLFDNLDTWADHNREIADSAGAAAEAHDRMADSASAAMDRLSAKWQAGKEDFGEFIDGILQAGGAMAPSLSAAEIRAVAFTETMMGLGEATEQAAADFDDIFDAFRNPERYERAVAQFNEIARLAPHLTAEWEDADAAFHAMGRNSATVQDNLNSMSESAIFFATNTAAAEGYAQHLVRWSDHIDSSLGSAADNAGGLAAGLDNAAAAAGRMSASLSTGSIAAIMAVSGIDSSEWSRRLWEISNTAPGAGGSDVWVPRVPTTGGGGGGGGGSLVGQVTDLDRARHAYRMGGSPQVFLEALREALAGAGEESVFMRLELEIQRLEETIQREADRAEAQAAEDERQAAEDRREMEDLLHQVGELTTEEYRRIIETRVAELEEYSDAWVQAFDTLRGWLAEETRQAQAEFDRRADADRAEWELTQRRAAEEDAAALEAAARRRRLEDLQFEEGTIGEAAYRRILQGRVGQFGRYEGAGLAAVRALRRLDKQAEQDALQLQREQLEELKKLNAKKDRVEVVFDPDAEAMGIRADTLRREVISAGARRGNRLAALPRG